MPISGKQMLKSYRKSGWVILRHKGSHVQVAIITIEGKTEHETIPMHKELKKGMEKFLLKRLKEVK